MTVVIAPPQSPHLAASTSRAYDRAAVCLKHDHYGQRLATAGLDHWITVWTHAEVTAAEQASDRSDLDWNPAKRARRQAGRPETDTDSYAVQWQNSCSFKAHDALLLQIDWAHPIYGALLLSCSLDGTARIWSESTSPQPAVSAEWMQKACFMVKGSSIKGAEFAPHQFGLKVATISADGFLRIYAAKEGPDLAEWAMLQEIDVSLSTYIHESLMPPGPAKDLFNGSIGPSGSAIPRIVQPQNATNGIRGQSQPSSLLSSSRRGTDSGWALSWIKDHDHGEVIAVACGSLNCVLIFHPGLSIASEVLSGHHGPVHTVSWAPSMGKSYQSIATGSQDGTVRIFRLSPSDDGSPKGHHQNPWDVELVASFDDHQDEIRAVDWNSFGTVLASSGDDGGVRLWKMNLKGSWQALTVVDSYGIVPQVI